MGMVMRQLRLEELCHQKVAELGLDPIRFKLTSIEAIAAVIRRAASLSCPCTSRSLTRSIVYPLRGLVEDYNSVRADVKQVLETMIMQGDLIKLEDFDKYSTANDNELLFAAPASFIPRYSGTQILAGISDFHFSAIPKDLSKRIEYVGHTRRLHPLEGENLQQELKDCGLLEISFDNWLNAPKISDPSKLISNYDRRLNSAGPSGTVSGLQILDTERPVRYYRGRWVGPQKRSGRFVARREQAYGAPLWSYVRLVGGEPEALIDLPLTKSPWRGCDEAWHLQMAIDKTCGKPQRFVIRDETDKTHIIAFFSPVPRWVVLRLNMIAERIPGELAYRISKDELPQELEFIRRYLFLEQTTNEG